MKERIFEALRIDHDIQRDLLEKLAATTGSSDERMDYFQKLKENLQKHAKFEERYFYAPLMDEDLTIKKARHSVHEHHKIDECLEDLEETDMSSSYWLQKLNNLKELVEHHLEEEEHEVFQLAGKALSKTQKTALAENYNQAMPDM